jgi:hypothetical protein
MMIRAVYDNTATREAQLIRTSPASSVAFSGEDSWLPPTIRALPDIQEMSGCAAQPGCDEEKAANPHRLAGLRTDAVSAFMARTVRSAERRCLP